MPLRQPNPTPIGPEIRFRDEQTASGPWIGARIVAFARVAEAVHLTESALSIAAAAAATPEREVDR